MLKFKRFGKEFFV